MTTLEEIRPITLADVQAARKRIAGTVLRTPLVRLDLGPGYPDIRLKLENLQPTNSYKLRGAANAVAMLTEDERAKGVWTISAGNAGQGVAFAGRAAGVPRSVVAIETAPTAKLERMRALGARVVPVSVTRTSRERSSIPSTITTSSPVTAPWAARSSRTCRRWRQCMPASAGAA
jgi:threonine dehydratase